MATAEKVVTTSYSLIGTGPTYFQQLEPGTVRYVIGASMPADDVAGYHQLGGNVGDGANYQGGENVYGRTNGGTIIVKATPIV